MARRKGLSLEEKRERMNSLFHETQDVFMMKDLEKLGPKRGVISQSVADVVQSLVDDWMVEKDKIGISNYFWGFPSMALVKRNNRIKVLDDKIADLQERLAAAQSREEAQAEARVDGDERDANLARLAELEEQYAELSAELQKFSDNDPELIEAMELDTKDAIDHANRWTDNIWTVKSWVVKKVQKDPKDIDKYFGIDPEMDYLPY